MVDVVIGGLPYATLVLYPRMKLQVYNLPGIPVGARKEWVFQTSRFEPNSGPNFGPKLTPTRLELGHQIARGTELDVKSGSGPRSDIQLRPQLHAPTSSVRFGFIVILPGTKI
ncbi:hypothetical protein C8R44DRAFT_731604 [Mycena epipterygia]|nr:hypothetical protein C8R44DRAFT_731604 [Mycena epipterygia]